MKAFLAILLLSYSFDHVVALVSTTTSIMPKHFLAVSSHHVSSDSSTRLFSWPKSNNRGEEDGHDENDDSSKEVLLAQQEFVNPFERKVTSATKRVPYLVSNTISLRQMRMKELMSKLLLTNTPEEIDEILHQNEDFLMEPLIQEEAILDKDSIYEVGMTVKERFERYNSVMVQREQQAVNDQVRRILASMREYVMSRSDG
jgi:hypothetical protein